MKTWANLFATICSEKKCMEVIFDVAKKIFHCMCNENMTFTSQHTKWKDQSLVAALKMDEERCLTKRKGKIISVHKHFKIIRHNHVNLRQ